MFLSYASQDAEAAKRICDALRAAGVEVWFDQSELRGGDAWDQKIRRQIKECALFMPVISQNTQNRPEGYFRLEWRLADQRTHLMGRNKAFLMPVCVDTTPDADADVPDSFTAVQWTKAPGGEVPPAFCARVKKLLGGTVAGVVDPGPASPRPATSNRPKRWLAPVIGGVVLGLIALVISRPWEKKAPVTAVAAPTSEIDRVRARIFPDRWQKGDFEAFSPIVDRLIQAHPDDAEAWALRSIINSLQVLRLVDPGTKPLEAGKTAAERALRLAPESPRGHLALGMHLTANVSRGGDPRASREPIDRAVAALPPDALTRYAELVSFWLGYDFENTERSAGAWLEAEPAAQYPAWVMTSMSVTVRRPDDVEKWAARSFRDQDITSVRALCNLIEAHYFLRADLAAARTVADRIPMGARAMPRAVYWRWLLAMSGQSWDEALQILAQVPDPMLLDVAYNGPKALLAGLAHQRAGRTEAAAIQFREAERMLRDVLASDPENEALRAVLAVTLASAGRGDEARRELALVEPLVRGRTPNIYRPRLVVSLAQAYGALGDFKNMAFWLRKLFAEPSSVPLTPASSRLDPRFNAAIDAPEISALLKEFAALDQPVVRKTADGGPKTGDGKQAAADPKSVAVLPFANLSTDKENEYFADGVQDDVITNLAKIRDLKVISRTSTLAYRDTASRNLKKIAGELGVANILEGSVRRSGSRVRVTAQLIDARTDAHLWADTFDGDTGDIFALQANLARQIAGALKATLTPSERTLIERRPTENQEAYDLFLRARAMHQEQGEQGRREEFERVVRAYELAIGRDPDFALAYTQLAQVHSIMFWFASLDPTPARAEKMKAAVDAAIRLAPNAPETHVALGAYHYRVKWDWPRALAEFKAAEAGLPNDAQLGFWLAITHRRMGRWQEAAGYFERASRLNPRDQATAQNMADYLVQLRRWEQGRIQTDRAMEYFPTARNVVYAQATARFAVDGDRAAFARALDNLPNPAGSAARAADRHLAALIRGDWNAAAEVLADGALTTLPEPNSNVIEDAVDFRRSFAAYLQGDAEAARRLGDRAIAYYRNTAWNGRQQAWAMARIAQCEAYSGRPEEAVRTARAAYADALVRDAYSATSIQEILGAVLVMAGRREEALTCLHEMMQKPSTSQNELRIDPIWSRLKDDPRFEEILKSAQPL